MSPKPKPIPDGKAGATPYLAISGAAAALDFYQKAFGATIVMRLDMPDGKVGHAEIMIGEGRVFLSEEYPEYDVRSPKTIGGSPVTINLYVPDVDAFVARAAAAGARVTRPVEDQFYGDRGGKLEDPFGHVWWIASHVEDVSTEEMQKRASAMFAG
ncbi:MAG: VOC family protein [Gemmatimonadota bacterium]